LFIISGASGTGKTTLCRQLENELGLFFSISATTRPKRAGEIDGRDYYFLSKTEFDKMVAEGKFLEWAQVHDNDYGTPAGPIQDHLNRGEDVLLDLDTQGAFQVKKTNPEAILIFIKPPSIDDLRKRLVARGTDSTQVIEGRIKRAEDEIKQSSSYGFVVINQDLEKAKEDLKKILSNPTLGKR
jgi:guanylate kinase